EATLYGMENALTVLPPRAVRQSLGAIGSATWKGRLTSHSLRAEVRGFAFDQAYDDVLLLRSDERALFASITYAGAYRYDRDGHKVRWRVFGGNSTDAAVFPVLVQGIASGVDPMRDQLFLSREGEGVAGTQVRELHGGLAGFASARGAASVVSGSVEVDLPAKLGVFAGAGVAEDWMGSAGVFVRLPSFQGTGAMQSSIRIPLAATDWFEPGMEYRPWEHIAVQFSINVLNPFTLVRSAVQP
ncbi:MAG: hypothetical protein ACO3YQ_05595, partial [Flavobacteriales bacterium]